MKIATLYVLSGMGALALAFLLTPLSIRVARRLNVLDGMGDGRSTKHSIPLLGGLAMVAAFAGFIMVAALTKPLDTYPTELLAVLLIALGLSTMGLIDDLRSLSPRLRFLLEVGAAVGLWAMNIRVQLTGITVVDIFLTCVWIVGVTNAFNLLDNMDGLSAAAAIAASITIFLVAATNDQYLIAALAVALAGCAAGFLWENFPPAAIYMGDAGSLFLGFLIAYLCLELRFDAPSQSTFIAPVLICGLAIFDTSLVVVSRIRSGVSPLTGGRDHTSHRLRFLGLGPKSILLVHFSIAASLGGLAVVVTRVDVTSAWLLIGSTALVGMTGFGILLHVPTTDDPGQGSAVS